MEILAIAPVLGIMAVSCPEPGEEDIWSHVTNLSQIFGTWKGPSAYSYVIEDIKFSGNYANYTMIFSNVNIIISQTGTTAQTYSNNYAITSLINSTMTANAIDKTITQTGTQTITYSGASEEYWLSLKQLYEYIYTGDCVTINFNDLNYSYTAAFNNFPMPYVFYDEYAADLLNSLQVNRNKTKIRMPVYPEYDYLIEFSKMNIFLH